MLQRSEGSKNRLDFNRLEAPTTIDQRGEYEPTTPHNGTEDNIDDESDADVAVIPLRYDITSFGIDFDIEGLVRRLNEGDVLVPDWQRHYVWNIRQASSFVESLLLGLPVPGIFLGTDPESGRLYVIDGQQRLKSLQFFYAGKFKESAGQPFKLTGVDDPFEGLARDDLDDAARRELNNSLIHATVVRQLDPPDNDTSMYQIYKRLNTGGNKVNAQEIRRAVYQGKLIDTIKQLNGYPKWREIVGKRSPRLKDQELILRFMAMSYQGDSYSKPMVEFLNTFNQRNRNPENLWLEEISDLFKKIVDVFAEAKQRPFRLHNGRVVNAAVFDSMAVGLAKRVENTSTPESCEIAIVHDSLIENEDYLKAVTQGTSDEGSVVQRLRIATYAFINA